MGIRKSERQDAGQSGAASASAPFGKVVLGTDGSSHSRRAAAFLAELVPAPRGHVTVVRVLEPMRPPSLRLLPAVARERLSSELAELERTERARAEKTLDAAAAVLARAGWRVETSVRFGVPVAELLAAVKQARADLLVVGGRGTGGVKRLLLGSVAEGVLKQAGVPVLVVN